MKLTNEELLEFRKMVYTANKAITDPRRNIRGELDKLLEKEPFLIAFNDKSLAYAEYEFLL